MKIKPIKNVNDFIIGLMLLALGIWILFTDNIVFGSVAILGGGILAHPETYVRFLGGLITFLAALLALKSLNWRRSTEVVPFHFLVTPHISLTVLALIVYAFLLPHVGFFISTFLLNFFLTCLFLHREMTGEGKPPFTRKDISRKLIHVAIYSVLLVFVVQFLFTRVLFVNLPALGILIF